MTTQSDLLSAVCCSHAAGISVVPPEQDGTKRPAGGWKQYQSRLPTKDEIEAWYAQPRTGIGWVTGAVSGNLEVIDFDDRSAYAEFLSLCDDAGLADLYAKIAGGYLEHSPNGAHLMYRCPEIAGNQKLAKNKAQKAKIETRGEGGYIVVAPTYGGVNARGSYVLQSGSIESIVTITPDERKALHDLARSLDELPPKRKIDSQVSSGVAGNIGTKPGDDYNARASWADILEPHGWESVFTRGGVTNWRRPGKKIGVSATTNHAGSGLLYVFSSSTGFDSEIGYSKFGAYSLLNHGEDFKAASQDLQLLGYGIETPDPTEQVNLGPLLSSLGIKRKTVKRQPLEELLYVPGLVGELADWIDRSAIKKQPILSVGAAIAAVGTIIGRKVQTQTGLRSNIYVLGVGETGCGKDRARQAIKTLFLSINAGEMIGSSFASDSAVESAVIESPACLYLIDEMGLYLETIKDKNAPSYRRSIMSMFLNLYSESESFFRRRTYVDVGNQNPQHKRKDSVEQPCLSIYGTTVPSNLYDNLTRQHASDGFLSRLLVFESNDPDPYPQLPSKADRAAPEALVAAFDRWHKAPTNESTEGNLAALRVDPPVVPATTRAWHVFDVLESEMRERRAAMRKAGEDQGPYTRVWATAQKLALIRSCGIKSEPEITEEDASWGCDLAVALTDRFLQKVGNRTAENHFEANTNRVFALIEKRGRVTQSQLTKMTQWLNRSSRNDIMINLIESGRVDVEGERPRVYSIPDSTSK